MTKIKVKTKQPQQPQAAFGAVEDDDPIEAQEVTELVGDGETLEDTPKESLKPPASKASKEPLVKIQFVKDMAAPEIGPYRFADHFRVSFIKHGTSFVVPEFVASHLTSHGAAVKVL